jgi:hypothetical protein
LPQECWWQHQEGHTDWECFQTERDHDWRSTKQ